MRWLIMTNRPFFMLPPRASAWMLHTGLVQEDSSSSSGAALKDMIVTVVGIHRRMMLRGQEGAMNFKLAQSPHRILLLECPFGVACPSTIGTWTVHSRDPNISAAQ